jgi:hypothetical protein
MKKVVTDCCGRLLPESQTLTGDVHFPELCPACMTPDWAADQGVEHERHVTCTDDDCPGPNWSYEDGRIVPST